MCRFHKSLVGREHELWRTEQDLARRSFFFWRLKLFAVNSFQLNSSPYEILMQ